MRGEPTLIQQIESSVASSLKGILVLYISVIDIRGNSFYITYTKTFLSLIFYKILPNFLSVMSHFTQNR